MRLIVMMLSVFIEVTRDHQQLTDYESCKKGTMSLFFSNQLIHHNYVHKSAVFPYLSFPLRLVSIYKVHLQVKCS